MRLIITIILGMSLTQTGFAQSPGVFSDRIVIGGVMDLEGQSRALGLGMRDGIQAALEGERVNGKFLEYISLNDSYTPELTIRQTNRLIDRGVFAMMGNVGTPTAKVSLPILAENNVPAIGFFTGAGILRTGRSDVVNFRASYVQETAKVIEQGFEAGLRPTEICAYVQNDAYGMAGVEGIKQAIRRQPGTRELTDTLDKLLDMQGDNPARNNIGPVGVYQRNTLTSREGYLSLKKWEKTSGAQCKLVVTVGTYSAIGRFAGYSKYQGDNWLISAVSFTGAENLSKALEEFGIKDRVLVTQVVPSSEADLRIIRQAKNALKERYNHVSLEGYIVGKMFISILRNIDGDITREKFVSTARDSRLDLGGLALDFRGDNQGSDLVTVTYLNNKRFATADKQLFSKLL